MDWDNIIVGAWGRNSRLAPHRRYFDQPQSLQSLRHCQPKRNHPPSQSANIGWIRRWRSAPNKPIQ